MKKRFAGKRIVLGVTGSIAAFKVAGWVSTLAQEEAIVPAILTDAARQFITPLTFSALSGEKVYGDMFPEVHDEPMAHIDLGRDADLFLIAPATAHTLAKLAHGQADNLVTTAALAARCPVVICPAMNTQMFSHPATQNNLKTLQAYGYHIVDPTCGLMACKEEGQGRLAEWDVVQEHLLRLLPGNDLEGEDILITAGPTQEAVDPARFLSNRSSGKMGFALARTAFRRGARVTLVTGPTALATPHGVTRIDVRSAQDMYDVVTEKCADASIIIKSAAVSDFRPVEQFAHKVKKDAADLTLHCQQNPDILKSIGSRKNKNQLLVGFAAESRDLVAAGQEKLRTKNLDLIAVNDIGATNTGFEAETNQLLLIDADGKEQLPLTSKIACADLLWDRVCSLRKHKNA